MRLAMLVAAALIVLLAGCGSTTPTGSPASPTPAASVATPAPTPTVEATPYPSPLAAEDFLAMAKAGGDETATLDDIKAQVRAAVAAHPGLDTQLVQIPVKFQDKALTNCWASEDELVRATACAGLVETWFAWAGPPTAYAEDVVTIAVAVAHRGLQTVPDFETLLRHQLGL